MSEIVKRGQHAMDGEQLLSGDTPLVVCWEMHANAAGGLWIEYDVAPLGPADEVDGASLLEAVVSSGGGFEFTTVGACPLHPEDVGAALGLCVEIARREFDR